MGLDAFYFTGFIRKRRANLASPNKTGRVSMESREWACWLFWMLFSGVDLSIGVLLTGAEVIRISDHSLHAICWALAFAIAAGLVRSWMIWRKSGLTGHWTLVSYAFVLVNVEIAALALISLYSSPQSSHEIQLLMPGVVAGFAFGAASGWMISLFAISSPQISD
jgi:hypothetical protein